MGASITIPPLRGLRTGLVPDSIDDPGGNSIRTT